MRLAAAPGPWRRRHAAPGHRDRETAVKRIPDGRVLPGRRRGMGRRADRSRRAGRAAASPDRASTPRSVPASRDWRPSTRRRCSTLITIPRSCTDGIASLLNRRLSHVFTEHGRLSDAPPKLKRRIANTVLSRFSGPMFAVSAALRRHMVAEGFPAGRVGVIHNGVELGREPTAAERRTARRLLGVGDDEFLVGTAARLDTVKDLPTLVAAIARARLRVAASQARGHRRWRRARGPRGGRAREAARGRGAADGLSGRRPAPVAGARRVREQLDQRGHLAYDSRSHGGERCRWWPHVSAERRKSCSTGRPACSWSRACRTRWLTRWSSSPARPSAGARSARPDVRVSTPASRLDRMVADYAREYQRLERH